MGYTLEESACQACTAHTVGRNSSSNLKGGKSTVGAEEISEGYTRFIRPRNQQGSSVYPSTHLR
jgi:hypothetical protein